MSKTLLIMDRLPDSVQPPLRCSTRWVTAWCCTPAVRQGPRKAGQSWTLPLWLATCHPWPTSRPLPNKFDP
jgi:hypothetical protein